MKKLLIPLFTIIGLGLIIGVIVLSGRDAAPNAVDQPAGNTTANGQTSDDQEQSTEQQTIASSESNSTAKAVTISNFAFQPAKITVKKGTTVTWTNQDSIRHDVAPDDPTDFFRKSDLLDKGESYSVTFSEVGTFTYHCTPHPQMTGTVEVTE
jgi:plastocyanin